MEPAIPASAASPELLESLRQLLGERFSTAKAVREHHSKGESYHAPALPDVVVHPVSTEEVAAVAQLCTRHRTPMVAFGAGTSLEGHVAALRGGVCVNLSGMNRIVAIRPEDMDVTVEAGVTRKQLDEALRYTGLFFPVDPGADATLGGMAATRASGTTTVRYGTMRENVLSLTAVLADGRVIKTGGRARKSAAGYDLTRLFVGSEGTLGIITSLTLRLYGRPDAVAVAVCPFENIDQALEAVIETIQLGIPVARIELLDELQVEAVNRFSGLQHPVVPLLFLEFHGPSQESVAEAARMMEEIAREKGASRFRWAVDAEERDRLWQARHEAYYAALALRPGAGGWTTDVCVPVSRLAECIRETRRDLAQSFLQAPLIGHVGEGNFHLIFLVDPQNPEDLAEARRLNDRLVERALALEGTCSGEHGIGSGKIHFLQAEHGEGVAVMRAIKAALDPHNLMNPGKIFKN